MPAVTVIVPAFNTENYIDECLDSILSQPLDDIEVICIDDGSSDRTYDVLAAWAERDARVHVCRQGNSGPGAARNAGIERATGEYLCFVDSDDLVAPSALQEMHQRAIDGSLDVLYFDAVPFFDDEELEPEYRRFEVYYRRSREYPGIMRGTQLMVQMARNADLRPAVWSTLVRTEYAASVGLRFPEGILHEDNLFSFLCGVQAQRVEYVPRTYYRRRVRKNSIMTMAKSEAHFAGFFVTSAEMLRYMTHNDLDREVIEMGARQCAEMYHQAVRVYHEIPASVSAEVIGAAASPESLVLGRILVREAASQSRSAQMGEALQTCENRLSELSLELEARKAQAEAAISDLESQLAAAKTRLKKTKAQLSRLKESRAYRFAQALRKIVRFGR